MLIIPFFVGMTSFSIGVLILITGSYDREFVFGIIFVIIGLPTMLVFAALDQSQHDSTINKVNNQVVKSCYPYQVTHKTDNNKNKIIFDCRNDGKLRIIKY